MKTPGQRLFVGAWPLTIVVFALAQPAAIRSAENKSAIHLPAVYLYYGGYQRGHKVNRFEERQIGLVKMKRDRYVAREADSSGGSFKTPVVLVNAGAMTLNVDAQAGEVQVQVLAPDGRPIPGFARTDCKAIRGDVLAAPVRWDRPLSVLGGRPVRLEFFLKNARLYAFELQAEQPLGTFLKENDPWKHPATSHALGTTVDQPWVDFRVQQFAAGTSSDSTTNARRAAADYANKPVFAFETSWEATPGKLTPDQVRTGAWGSLMGGAFYLYAECFEPTLTWGDGGAFRFVEIMHVFFAGLPYWKLKPDPALVNSGSLCLADPEHNYVIYRQSGGTIVLDLANIRPAAVFKAEWLDPRTGARRTAGTVTGGAPRSFACPDAHDWVLHLARADASTK